MRGAFVESPDRGRTGHETQGSRKYPITNEGNPGLKIRPTREQSSGSTEGKRETLSAAAPAKGKSVGSSPEGDPFFYGLFMAHLAESRRIFA